ncbi:MAG: hypothetical protein FWC26_15450 [Fibromonadales bacterium]|nr:hypothetical protein [Fibromonadales bacterium]
MAFFVPFALGAAAAAACLHIYKNKKCCSCGCGDDCKCEDDCDCGCNSQKMKKKIAETADIALEKVKGSVSKLQTKLKDKLNDETPEG